MYVQLHLHVCAMNLTCLIGSFHQFLYVVQLAERLERGQVVDVQAEYLVADLAENRVVELEEVHLHPTVCCPLSLVCCPQLLVVDSSLELLQDDICPRNNGSGHARELRYMNAKAMFRPASFELAKEDNLPVDFLHAHIKVFDAREGAFHLVQLMIVCGKESAGMASVILVYVLDDGPCN